MSTSYRQADEGAYRVGYAEYSSSNFLLEKANDSFLSILKAAKKIILPFLGDLDLWLQRIRNEDASN